MTNTTLKSELQYLQPDAIHRIRNKLVGVQMLACVQTNLMDDIKHILEEQGKWRYTIKHNMKQIRDLCERNIRDEAFFGRLSQDAMDVYMEDYEKLEQFIYNFIDNDD